MQQVTPGIAFVFSALFAISIVTIMTLRIVRYFGGRNLLNLMTGKYYRPVLERRVFLFLDINGSTAAVCKSWADRHIQLGLRFAVVLVLPVFLLPAVEALAEKLADKPAYKKYFPGIIGNDDRESVPRSFSAYNAVGKINIRGTRTVQGCTGTLIAPNLVVTAAHCLFSKGSGRLFSPRSINFVTGVLGDKYLAHATAKCVHLAKSYRNPATDELRMFFNDVAVVVLDKKLDIPPIAPVAEDSFKEDSLLVHPSYPQDSRYRLKVHSGCRLQRKKQGIWLTNCDTNYGSSGGPVLVSKNQQYQLAAVLVGGSKEYSVVIPISAWRHLIKKEHSCADHNPAQDRLNQGLAYSLKGYFDQAIAEYNGAIKLNPNEGYAYVSRGDAYQQMGLWEKAIADLNTAIRFDLKEAFAYFNRGYAYSNKRDYDRAIADYDKAIRLNPNYASAYFNRSEAYSNKRDYDRAIADFDKAITLDPNYASAYNPNYASAYNNRGIVYMKKRDYDRAIADYGKAIALDQNYTYAYINRGFAYAKKGEQDRAIADYDKAIALNPKYASAHINRGLAYAKKGEHDRAIADYDKAIALNPKYASYYYSRGNSYYNKGQYDSAIADYDKAIRLNPKYTNAYGNRGFAYEKKGDRDNAITDFRKAIELVPGDRVGTSGLKRLGVTPKAGL